MAIRRLTRPHIQIEDPTPINVPALRIKGTPSSSSSSSFLFFITTPAFNASHQTHYHKLITYQNNLPLTSKMKFSLAILAFAAAVSAQEIVACDGKAQPCIEDAIADSGVCDAGDYACACENIDAIQDAATPCVLEACGGVAGARKSSSLLSSHPCPIYPSTKVACRRELV